MASDCTLYEGDFVRIKRNRHWEYAERVNARGAVIIVAVTARDELLLVEQPRAPVAGPVVELPAGLVGDTAAGRDEALAAAAARELEEETGFRPARVEFLVAGPPSAGLASEMIYFYRAHDVERVHAGGGDASERITPHAVPLDRVRAWLARREADGVLVDPKVYAGLYFVTAAAG